MNEFSSSDWTKLGHSSSVVQGATSLFSFLGARASASVAESSFEQYTTAFSSKVTLTLTMKGTPVIFNVNGGYWSVYLLLLPFLSNIYAGTSPISALRTPSYPPTAPTCLKEMCVSRNFS